MSRTMYHCCLNVRGMLKNGRRRELAAMFRSSATGKRLTADEAKDVLLDHLAKGHEVIPLDPTCEGFDFTGGGCPGHSVGDTR